MYWRGFPLVYLSAAAALCGAGLDDFITRALERNADLRAAAERITEARGLARHAGLRPAPSVEMEGATGRATGTTGAEEFAFGFSQSVETAGKREKRVQAAGAAIDLARAEWEQKSRALAAALKDRYITVWEQREKERAISRLLEVGRDALRLTDARVREGDAAPLERELLKVDLERAEAQRAGFSGRAEAALLELEALSGLPSEFPEWTEPPAIPALSELRQRVDARPDVRAARAEERQAAFEADLAAAQGRADLTLSARYAHRNERFDLYGLNASGAPAPLRDRDNVLSFGLSMPLFARGRNQGNTEAAGARAAAARLRRERLERAAPLEVEAAWRRYQAAQRARELLDNGVLRPSRENLKVVRQAYELGHLRMLDVLNEQRRLIDTELASLDAQAECMRALVALETAVGGLQ